MIHTGDPAADGVAAPQYPAKWYDDVTRFDRTRGGLGQEGLVGHLRLRIDHGDDASPSRGLDCSPSAAYIPT